MAATLSHRVDTSDVRLGQSQPVSRRSAAPAIDVAAVLRCATPQEAFGRLTDLVAERLNTRAMLAVGRNGSGPLTLVGDSECGPSPRRLRDGEPLEQACREALVLRRTSSSTEPRRPDEIDTPVARDLARWLETDCVTVQPLGASDDEPVCVVVTVGPANEVLSAAEQETVGAIASAVQRIHEPVRNKATRQLREGWTRGRGRWRLAAVLGAACLMALPVPFRPVFICTCEPAVKRVVVAPFDAVIAEVVAKPGDRIDAGDVLARLDDKDFRDDLASVIARREQAEQRRVAALRTRDALQAETERLQIAQLDFEESHLRRQIDRLVLRSPLDGVVLRGDLDVAVGAAVARGQTLMEVAETEELLARVEIDESVLTSVRVGASVTGSFGGGSAASWRGAVQRIAPAAERIDRRNVFLAEASLPWTPDAPAPGMRGTARVACGWEPLGWVLARRPLETLRRALGG